MTAVQTLWMLSVVFLMAGGQVLFKLAAGRLSAQPAFDLAFFLNLATNVYLIIGLAVYALTTLLWVLLLRDVPLSRAYPFTALTLVLVPLFGILLFGEKFSWPLVVGGVLMLSGLAVLTKAL